MAEKWIDVSYHNGKIDWEKVAASGIRGAIIRAGYGGELTQKDKRFDENMVGAVAAGLKVAVYWFGYPDSADDAKREWEICKQVIERYRNEVLFIAYDYEYDSRGYFKELHGYYPSNMLINTMVTAFLNAAKSDGWKTCLYMNNDYRLHIFNASTLETPDYLWLADYSGGPDIPCAIQQTGSDGRVPGISGNVDMDTVFTDIGAPEFTCDTSGTVEIARGAAYQAKIVSNSAPTITAGTGDVVTILSRFNNGNERFYYFVPIGSSGAESGIYINGNKQFIVKIK
ncbi:MAG: Glycoside hydrolase family 25 [Oscillospiraceae bacterium]|jgi:lysozyme